MVQEHANSGLSAADWQAAQAVITLAIAEDLGRGDITSQAVIPETAWFSGVLAARQALVVAGLEIAIEVFRQLAPEATVIARVNDGARVEAGTVLVEIAGPARALLSAERLALNMVQHLSGIATLVRRHVDVMAGSGVVLLDTRKTIPGLRRLAKYATRMGGGANHRMGLDDAILIKDNHIAVCGSLSAAVQRARHSALGPVEVECDTLEQVAEAVAAGAERVLLDNMAPDMLRQAVTLVAGRAETEASGGITIDNLAAIAATGVDFISVGRLTQSAPAVDIGLDWHYQRDNAEHDHHGKR